MDTYLISAERAAEAARDLAEVAEELRCNPPRFDLIDDELERTDTVRAYLTTVDPYDFYQDHPEALHLPSPDCDRHQVIANRLRGRLLAAHEARQAQCRDTLARISVEITESLLDNLAEWLEETA